MFPKALKASSLDIRGEAGYLSYHNELVNIKQNYAKLQAFKEELLEERESAYNEYFKQRDAFFSSVGVLIFCFFLLNQSNADIVYFFIFGKFTFFLFNLINPITPCYFSLFFINFNFSYHFPKEASVSMFHKN